MAVASVAPAPGAAVIALGPSGTRPCDSDKLLRPLRSQSKPRVFVYEAGPCGSWLARALTQHGSTGWGGAPSWRPKKTGARGTTARRDARPRARLMRSGALTPVSVPAVDDAAMRARRRARDDPLRALQAAQGRCQACLLRQARRSTGRAHWSPAPLRWRSAVICATPAPHMVLPDDVQTVTAQTERRGRLALALPEPGHTGRLAPVGEARQALRGASAPAPGPRWPPWAPGRGSRPLDHSCLRWGAPPRPMPGGAVVRRAA
jgi:hypothetical protein